MTPRRNLPGILLMLLAVSLLSLMDAGLKALSADYPPLEVAALRGAASWPLAALWVFGSGGAARLFAVRWRWHLLRGAIGVATLSAFVYGLRYLPLATAYTLFFVAPLLITALSVPLLGERVSRARWIAILCGFGGVLVALRPTGAGLLSWAAAAVLCGAVGYAVSAITVRILARTDSTQAIVFWLLTLMTLGAAALAAPDWIAVRREHWWLVVAVGTVGVLGQFAITGAFARAEASVIAPLEYTALAWGVGFDALVWAMLPDGATFAGAAIVVASGLYLMRRERRREPVPA